MGWIVEIDNGGINWTPIALCHSEKQAHDLAGAPHLIDFGKPVRVREQWKMPPGISGSKLSYVVTDEL